jgi:hypothetical protein
MRSQRNNHRCDAFQPTINDHQVRHGGHATAEGPPVFLQQLVPTNGELGSTGIRHFLIWRTSNIDKRLWSSLRHHPRL